MPQWPSYSVRKDYVFLTYRVTPFIEFPIRIVDFVSEIVNANRYDAIFVQTKTRETPRQRYGRTLSAIPKPIHYRQVNQPYNSILGLRLTVPSFFSFGHFHRFLKNGDTELTTLGRVSFVIPPSFIFSLCVYGL